MGFADWQSSTFLAECAGPVLVPSASLKQFIAYLRRRIAVLGDPAARFARWIHAIALQKAFGNS